LLLRGFKQPALSVAVVCRSVLAILRPQSADTWAECQAMMAGKIFQRKCIFRHYLFRCWIFKTIT
jgi:hypothetical protein